MSKSYDYGRKLNLYTCICETLHKKIKKNIQYNLYIYISNYITKLTVLDKKKFQISTLEFYLYPCIYTQF